jgi:hypothetical protein
LNLLEIPVRRERDQSVAPFLHSTLTRLPERFDHPAFDIFRCEACGFISWIAQSDK